MSISAAEERGPIVLFDGVCNLCTGSVRFVIARDSRRRFRVASLQSPAAERLLGRRDNFESLVLVENGRTYRKSTAALRIARRLDGLWPALCVLLLVPRRQRDAVYDWIGARRYRWFGRTEVCWTPRPELAEWSYLRAGSRASREGLLEHAAVVVDHHAAAAPAWC